MDEEKKEFDKEIKERDEEKGFKLQPVSHRVH